MVRRALWQLEIFPRQRKGDGRAWTRSRRVGRDCGRSTLVAQVVEINFSLASGLGHLREIKRGIVALHDEDEIVRERFDVSPGVFRLDGSDDVQAFAAGCFEKRGEA